MQENKNREYGLFPNSNLSEMLYTDATVCVPDNHLQYEEHFKNVPDPPPETENPSG